MANPAFQKSSAGPHEFLNINGIEDYVFRQQMHKNLISLTAIALRADEEQDEEYESFVADESFD